MMSLVQNRWVVLVFTKQEVLAIYVQMHFSRLCSLHSNQHSVETRCALISRKECDASLPHLVNTVLAKIIIPSYFILFSPPSREAEQCRLVF